MARQQYEIEDGAIVRFHDTPQEFTVSNWDGRRGWAGDEDNQGWYFTADQVIVLWPADYDEEDDEDEDWDE